jgi:hypothetical protein
MGFATIIDSVLALRPPFAVKAVEEALDVALAAEPRLTMAHVDIWMGLPRTPGSPLRAVELRLPTGPGAGSLLIVDFADGSLLSEDELVSRLGPPESFDAEPDAIAVRLAYSREWGSLEFSFDADGQALQGIALAASPYGGPPQPNA